MRKIIAALKLSRPFTLVAPIIGGLLFSYLGYLETGGNILKIPLVAIIFALTNYTSNVINQIYDREIDKINKPDRPIPKGEISVDEAMSLSILLTIITLSLAYTLINTVYGILLSIILIFAWLYSSPPLRLRSRLWLNNLAIATPRGALGIIAAYSAYSNPLMNYKLLIFALAMGIYVYGGNTFKDFSDERGDKMFGVRNFVTVYGRRTATKLSCIFMAVSAPLVIISTHLLMAIPFIAMVLLMVFIAYKNPEMKSRTENNVTWALFYIGLCAAFLSYFASNFLYS